MTPLQRVAMGLVIVLVDASFGGYDGVPDPLGWAMVVWGVASLRDAVVDAGRALPLAGVSLLVSVATYPPQVSTRLDESAGWALSLPQLAFSVLLCAALEQHAGWLSGRFRALKGLFVALALAPAVVFGGGVDALREPLAFVVVATNVYFVYVLFQASRTVPASTASAGPSEAKTG